MAREQRRHVKNRNILNNPYTPFIMITKEIKN